MALHTLIIGLGRAGLGLHLPVLLRARADHRTADLFADHPVVGVDPAGPAARLAGDDLVVVGSLRRAAEVLHPARTVVHLCTPPAARGALLDEVVALGFSRIVVEKPVASGPRESARVRALAGRRGLRLSVVAPWLHSALTRRLVELVTAGELGCLRSVSVTQHKARFGRSLTNASHTTALDVEVPHALGVALRLAGDAEVTAAGCADLRAGGSVVPAMGGARLTLDHHTGVRTEISSDLTSPVRQRRIVLELAGGTVTGDYPVGEDDHFAQLRVGAGRDQVPEVLPDDALTAYLVRTYRWFATAAGGRTPDPVGDVDLHLRTAALLDDARRLCAVGGTGGAYGAGQATDPTRQQGASEEATAHVR